MIRNKQEGEGNRFTYVAGDYYTTKRADLVLVVIISILISTCFSLLFDLLIVITR